jgi:hypothetical protein
MRLKFSFHKPAHGIQKPKGHIPFVYGVYLGAIFFGLIVFWPTKKGS